MDAITNILASSTQRVYMHATPAVDTTESVGSTGALLYDMPANGPEYGSWASA
jgi:hypothetical protein